MQLQAEEYHKRHLARSLLGGWQIVGRRASKRMRVLALAIAAIGPILPSVQVYRMVHNRFKGGKARLDVDFRKIETMLSRFVLLNVVCLLRSCCSNWLTVDVGVRGNFSPTAKWLA
eukprot:3699476-Rhodomonas_salina.2